MNLPTRNIPADADAAAAASDATPSPCADAEARLIERLHLQQCVAPDDFARNYAVGPYTLRLYFPSARLALEIEACSGKPATAPALERLDATALRRAARDSFLQSVGIEVLRVSEDELESTDELEALVVRIARQIERRMRAQRESASRKQLKGAAQKSPPAAGSSYA